MGLFFLISIIGVQNQTVMQRALAAKSVSHAQSGLMIGGLIKYIMAVIIVIPGIALYGILGDSFSLNQIWLFLICKNLFANRIKRNSVVWFVCFTYEYSRFYL